LAGLLFCAKSAGRFLLSLCPAFRRPYEGAPRAWQEGVAFTTGASGLQGSVAPMIAEYLEHALQFERMAAEATDPALKESLARQAVAYRKLAAERAERLNLARLPPSD